MAIGILGSGFGIYGYLPALANSEVTIVVLEKARQRIEDRIELVEVRNQIHFVDSLQTMLGRINKLVIALPPQIQKAILTENDFSGIELFLEKPLGNSLEDHLQLDHFLRAKNLRFKVAYLFLYTEWFRYIAKEDKERFSINWTIPKGEAGWKTDLINDHGIESYYGMHFYPLYRHLDIPASQLKIWGNSDAMRIIDENSKIDVRIKLGEFHKFEVNQLENTIWHHVFTAESPFGNLPQAGVTDPRVKLLCKYLDDNDSIIPRGSSLEIEDYILQCRVINRNSGTR